MLTWIIIGIVTFILFIAGIITLFFPSKRVIGSIIVVSAMVLFVITTSGLIMTFKHYQKMNEEITRYSTNKDTKKSNAVETKEYNPRYLNKESDVETKISAVKVEKKPTYSTLKGKKVSGSVTVTLSITNHAEKALKTYPNQGELKTSKETINGGDAILSDFPKSDVKQGKTIKGKLVFPLVHIKKVSDISWISLSWLSYLDEMEQTIQHETGKIDLK